MAAETAKVDLNRNNRLTFESLERRIVLDDAVGVIMRNVDAMDGLFRTDSATAHVSSG